ncbi:O-antigen ligase family protein [Pseudoalteromonas denitrificans]|nr:O-antigen ligase family protein [Pseudoalteromonas denitrificans]
MCLVIFESDGLITKLVGFDTVIGAWLFAFSMICFLFLSLLRLAKDKNFCEIKSFYYPLVAFTVFFIVSFISGNFIFVKPMKDWLPSLYVFAPIFVFYFLYFFKYTSKEVIWSFIWVAILISLLLITDRISNLSFLDEYQRRSAFFALDVRRIVLLKNEVIFGFVAVMSLLIIGNRSKKENQALLLIAGLLFLVQAFVMESRMGFLAMGVATITLMCIKGLTKKVFRLYVVGLIAVVFVFPIVFAKQIESLGNMSMHDSESNISIRFETVEHFYHTYIESEGFGIGSMSSNGQINNILNSEEHNNIVDAGAYSSLFQFGPLGLLIWILFTYQCLKTYLMYFKKNEKTDPHSASVFAFLMSFTLSLLPISFFTASWCIAIGGVLLYFMWLFRTEMMNS